MLNVYVGSTALDAAVEPEHNVFYDLIAHLQSAPHRIRRTLMF